MINKVYNLNLSPTNSVDFCERIFKDWISKVKTQKIENNLKEHFKDTHNVKANNFCIETFCNELELSLHTAEILLSNLEDSTIIKEIANNNFENFDILDSEIFNDCYYDMIIDLINDNG